MSGSFAWSWVTEQYEFWPGVDQDTADLLQAQQDEEDSQISLSKDEPEVLITSEN